MGEREPSHRKHTAHQIETDIGKLVSAAESAAREVGPWTDCPNCEAPPQRQSVRNYDPIWMDGDVYCNDCGGFVRYWDAG